MPTIDFITPAHAAKRPPQAAEIDQMLPNQDNEKKAKKQYKGLLTLQVAVLLTLVLLLWWNGLDEVGNWKPSVSWGIVGACVFNGSFQLHQVLLLRKNEGPLQDQGKFHKSWVQLGFVVAIAVLGTTLAEVLHHNPSNHWYTINSIAFTAYAAVTVAELGTRRAANPVKDLKLTLALWALVLIVGLLPYIYKLFVLVDPIIQAVSKNEIVVNQFIQQNIPVINHLIKNVADNAPSIIADTTQQASNELAKVIAQAIHSQLHSDL